MVNEKALIFDVDGTLWDSTSRIAESYNETIQKLGLQGKKITTDIVRKFMGFVREDIADIVFSEYPIDDRLKYIDICMEEECAYLAIHAGVLYPCVEDVLKILSENYDIFIVSNCQNGYIETLFASYPLHPMIKDYECSGRTGMKKGENIKLVMDRNHITNAVYIGDTIKDKEASDIAQIPFIYASYGFGEVNDYEVKIDSFKELLNIL